MGLTNGRQHLTNGQQVLFKFEMPKAAQAMEVHQAAACTFNAFLNKGIGQFQFGCIAKDFFVDGTHLVGNFGQGIAPSPIGFRSGIKLIDACFTGFLVFQQKVGEPAIS